MSLAIEVSGLGKRYRLGVDTGSYDTLRDALRRSVTRDRDYTETWALRDLSFTVAQGETLGVIGRNGAGKTTLLKVLAGITPPTEGRARTRGQVGALLDVGTGFHPELTGRENIYLNGAILGLRRKEIDQHLEAIIEFAGITRFLDTPVKRYSTGMRLRLAFAVAAHIEPPILVVDEVLAVGDRAFREKCLGKIAEIGRHNRTVLFVSHDLGAIASVCPRVIWLRDGGLADDGAAANVLAAYVQASDGQALHAEFEPADSVAVLESAAVCDEAGQILTHPRRDQAFVVVLRFVLREHVPGLDVAVSLIDTTGTRVLYDARADWTDPLPGQPGTYEVSVAIPPLLTPGRYMLEVWIGSELETLIEREVLVIPVQPHPEDPQELTDRPRVVQPQLGWTVDHQAESAR